MSAIYGKGGEASGTALYGLGGVASGTPIYTTEVESDTAWTPVIFDGTNDYLSTGSSLTGLVNGVTGTMAVRLSPNTDGVAKQVFSGSGVLALQQSTSNRYEVYVKNSIGTTLVYFLSDTHIASEGYVTLLVSWDLSVSPTVHFYRDGVSPGSPVTLIAGTVDYVGPSDWGAMGRAIGTDPYDGDVTFFYFDDAYIDLSVSANRDKFLQDNIGASGDGPTGSDPIVYLTGDASEWNDVGGINLGTGGPFYMSGEVIDV